MRAVLVGFTAAVVMATPAHATTASGDGVTVSVDDLVWPGYGCLTHLVSVSVDAAGLLGWVVAAQAGVTGGSRLDAVGFSGRGPATTSGGLLLCPADSNGSWTVAVSGRVGLQKTGFTLGFTVSRAATSTVVESARRTEVATRVRGVVTAGAFPGRAGLQVHGRRNGRWRVLGHTYPRADGRFRFETPEQVGRVRVSYLGDDVTDTSSAGAVRVSTSSSP